MRKTYAGLTALLVVAVVAEFFFAASGTVAPGLYRPHHVLGYVVFLLPVAMAAVAAAARMPGWFIGMAALVAGLTGVQVAVAKLARAFGDTAGGLVFGLHAVNGLALAVVVGLIARRLPALRS